MSAEKAANALAELRRKLDAKQKAEREALGKEEQAGEHERFGVPVCGGGAECVEGVADAGRGDRGDVVGDGA